MQYRYTAFAANGQPTSGTIEANSRDGAALRLREQGMLIQSMKAAPEFKLSLNMELGAVKLNLRQQSVFFSQMAMLIKGGVPILQSLQVLAANARSPLKMILEKMIAEVETGSPLSRSMANRSPAFAPIAVQVLGISEYSGEMDRGLRMLAEQFDAEDQLQRKFVSALYYPVTVLVMALSLAIFMVMFIVPQYAGMFEDMGAELPWQTRALLAVSKAAVTYWWAGLVLILGLIFFIYINRKSEDVRVKVHQAILKMPIFGPLMQMREVARYTRAVGTLMKAGVPVVTATEASAEVVENLYLSGKLRRVPEAITGGSTLGKAVKAADFLPPIFAELLIIGEIISNADETMDYVGSIAESDVKQTVERLTSIMEPVFILLLGGIVFVIVVPLLLPMFDLYTKIK